MSTTPNMGMILPDDHDATEADVWGALLVTALGINDAHDHSPGKGVLIPMTGIKANADKSWSFGGSSFAITDLKAVDFAPVASSAVTGFAGALFVSDGSGGLAANELYWRTTSGSNVRLTSGAALNIATFVGGIGGDYSAVGALLDYDDATDTYRFRQETAASVRQFGKVQFADIKLMEHDPAGDATVPSFGVTIRSPDALAANYTVTWPGALPGALQLMTLSAAGDINTANNAASALTIGNALTVTTLLTANAGITVGNNQDVLLQGTGVIKHGQREIGLAASDFQERGTCVYEAITVPTGPKNYNATWRFSGAANTLFASPNLRVGDRIVSVSAIIGQSANTGGDVTAELKKCSQAAGTSTIATFTRTFTPGVGTTFAVSLLAVNYTIATGEFIELAVASTDATASDHLIGALIVWDRP